MKKIVTLLAVFTLMVAASTFAQNNTYNFGIKITDASSVIGDIYVIRCAAYPVGQPAMGPLYVSYVVNNSGWTTDIVAPLSRYFPNIVPPGPPVPLNFIYFRVWVEKNGVTRAYCDSQWFSYSAGGWTSLSLLPINF